MIQYHTPLMQKTIFTVAPVLRTTHTTIIAILL